MNDLCYLQPTNPPLKECHNCSGLTKHLKYMLGEGGGEKMDCYVKRMYGGDGLDHGWNNDDA